MADQTQRLEIATVRTEVGSNIVYRFANDAANEGGIPTDSGSIQNLKQVIAEIQEDGAEKISIATTIYQTAAAGLAATADGGIFLVQSSDADTIYTVWKNQAGAAVNTGKTAMSSQAIQDALTASNEAAQAAEDAADVATARTAGFLQPAAVAPVIRDNGLPLQEGDRYFNTEDQTEYLYKTEAWAANDSLEAIAGLQNSSDPSKGASQIGWDGEPINIQLDLSRKVSDYTALRAYVGLATRLEVMAEGLQGIFKKRAAVPGDVDNGGTLIISTDGLSAFSRVVSGNINVRWFGAKLDGVTDDSATIQAAINGSPVGSTIEIPASLGGGVAAGLVVNKKVHILSHEGGLKQKAATSVPLITYLGVSGFKLRGLSIDGNKANQLVQTNTVVISGCSNFKVTDIAIDGSSYNGIRVEANTDVHPARSYLRNVESTRASYCGIELYDASRISLVNCSSCDNAGYGFSYNSSIEEAGSDIIISGGNYDYNGYTGVNFPYFNYTGLKGRCGKAQVIGVSACFNGSNYNGITLQGKEKSATGCTANNNGLQGIMVNGQRCSVSTCTTNFNGSVGIDFGDCEDITCTGNSVFSNQDIGIEINSCLRGTVCGNTVNGNNIHLNSVKAGIALYIGSGGYPFIGPTSGISVTGNFVGPGPNQDFGIYLSADTSENFVGGNTTTNAGAVQDVRCISALNIVTAGASHASHMGAASQITIPTAATVTIPDAQEVVFLTGTVNVATITSGNLYAGRSITLIFNSSTPSILTTGNILTGVSPVANWRPIRLTYIKSLEKWAVMETKTF